MKLLYSPTSPYVRKVRVVAREKDLMEDLTEVISLPFDEPPELIAINPLGKVPALIRDNGSVLFDSPVICEYLDHLKAEPQLIPAHDAGRWPALRAQALADGVLDAAVAGVLEMRRPANEQSKSTLEHWQDQIRSAVVHMHKELAAQEAELTIGHIAMAVALSYLDFRYPDLQWRVLADQALIEWHTVFEKRPSMLETAPPD
jgi:glutathione S-transferase